MIARILVTGLLLAAPAWAQDTAATADLKQSFERQQKLPGYVEVLYGHALPMPTATGVVTDAIVERAKQAAVEKVQEKVATAAARVPVAGDLAQRAVSGLGDPTDEMLKALGPERRIGTIEHSGNRHRYNFPDSGTEMVRADGRIATRVNLAPQIAQLQLAAVSTGETMYREVRGARATFKAVLAQAQKGGIGGLLAISDIFDQLNAMRGEALTAAEILKAIATLQHLSGKWQCEPDPLEPAYRVKGLDFQVQQVADEVIDGAPAHVYEGSRTFVPTSGETAQSHSYQLSVRTWIRISDGLPIRYEMTTPGSLQRIRTDIEYPASVDVVVPECAEL